MEQILNQRIEHQKITQEEPLLAFSYSEGVIDPEDKKTNKRDFIMVDKYNKIFSRTEINDIIYNPANVIHGAIHRNKLKNGVVSPIYKIFYPNENISSKYLGERLHTDKFIAEISKYIEGTVVKLRTLSPEKFLDMSIEIPVEYKEQENIGLIFEKINNLITLHQRKYDKLVAVKKSLLEKMFPNDNSVFPDIRFKGYTEAWEQCELSKLGKIETGNTPSTTIEDYYSDTGLLWVTPTDIISNILVNTDKKLTSKGMAVARVIPANSILCTCIASIGKNAFLPVKCAFNQQINALTPYDGNHPYFLFTNSYNWSQTMKKGAGGLTFQIVNKTEFSNIKTYVPKYNEQKEIGDLFYKLDNLITLHQRKCEKLKNLKKSLLEKMFC